MASLKEGVQTMTARIRAEIESTQRNSTGDLDREAQEENSRAELLRLVDEARREWDEARQAFEAVSETDLIDHAVHRLVAAEKRYTYLLQLAKRERVQGPVLAVRQYRE